MLLSIINQYSSNVINVQYALYSIYTHNMYIVYYNLTHLTTIYIFINI